MNVAAALRAARRGRDKSAYYRMWHLRQRAGLAWPDTPAPGAPVPFETALVALGQETGKLEECLRLLADYFAAEDRTVLTVIRKATYPMFVALAAVVIGPLPLLFTAGAGAYAMTAGGGLLLWSFTGGSLLAGTMRWFLGQPRYLRGRLLRALTIAIEAGLPPGRAATLAAEASGSAAIVAHLRRQGARAAASQPLATTFAGCPHLPRPIIAAMEVADASGDYSGTLRKMAELEEG